MVAQEQGLNEDALLEILLKMPNVFSSDKAADPAQEEFDFIMKLAEESFEAFDAFRISEGDKMEADLDNNRAAILSLLGQVEALDPARNESVRIRLDERLKTLSEKVNVDCRPFRARDALLFGEAGYQRREGSAAWSLRILYRNPRVK